MNRKALVVGIDNYPDYPLSGCVNDAKLINNLLEMNEDGSKNFDVLLKENIATKEFLLRYIRALFSGDEDIALFYFSGHGYSDGQDEYIVTPDMTPDIPGIKMSDILGIVINSKCKNKIIILDCCYSGGMGCSQVVKNENSILGNGVTIFSASRKNECANEIEGHGVFTALLAEALRGGASDLLGNVTPGLIYAYIDKSLGPWDEQRPVFKTNVEQFVSLRKVTPPIDTIDLRSISVLFPDKNYKFPLDPSFEFKNNPNEKQLLIKPYANEYNVKKFKILQHLERVGLVEPVGEEHMYFAAMNSKSCRLTKLGQYYWMLSNKNRF